MSDGLRLDGEIIESTAGQVAAEFETQLFEVLLRPCIAARIAPSHGENARQIFAVAEMIENRERIAACRDPADDKFLELAVNGAADMIVTGDIDLLVLNPFRGVPIADPRGFVERIGGAT